MKKILFALVISELCVSNTCLGMSTLLGVGKSGVDCVKKTVTVRNFKKCVSTYSGIRKLAYVLAMVEGSAFAYRNAPERVRNLCGGRMRSLVRGLKIRRSPVVSEASDQVVKSLRETFVSNDVSGLAKFGNIATNPFVMATGMGLMASILVWVAYIKSQSSGSGALDDDTGDDGKSKGPQNNMTFEISASNNQDGKTGSQSYSDRNVQFADTSALDNDNTDQLINSEDKKELLEEPLDSDGRWLNSFINFDYKDPWTSSLKDRNEKPINLSYGVSNGSNQIGNTNNCTTVSKIGDKITERSTVNMYSKGKSESVNENDGPMVLVRSLISMK